MQSGVNPGNRGHLRSATRISKLPLCVALMALVASGASLVAQNAAAPAIPKPTPTLTSAKSRSSPSKATSTAVSLPAHAAHRPALAHQKPAATPPPPPQPVLGVAQTAPPEPPKPDWPANDKPTPAKVTWDTQGLTIQAVNSSLDQILNDIATDTGAKLDGKVGDERVFGTYGPGPARDIISQLLDGTSYNVLMVGDQGSGTPRQIVLSNRPTGPAPANRNAQNNGAEDESEYEPPQPMPITPPMRTGFGPQGMPPDQNQQNGEERRAEFEQRMEQMRQQQQEQQQQQQQTPPQ